MGRVLRAIAAVCALSAMAGENRAATAADLYRVQDIAVDERAGTASTARQKALEKGQVRALERMLRRLTLSRDWPLLPPVGPELATELVAAIEINDERMSSRQYQARLTVEFEASGIRGLLRRTDIPFSEARFRPVLILPVYEAGGLVSLWADTPWRRAWQTVREDGGLIPYVLPQREGFEDTVVSGDTAMALGDDALVVLRRRYSVASVIAVRAGVERNGDAAILRIDARDYGAPDGDRFEAEFRGDAADIGTLMRRGADAVSTHLEDAWKRQTLARFDERRMITTEVPLASLRDWTSVKRRLQDNLLVDRIEILGISSRQAKLRLHHLGDVDHLRLSLAQTGLLLTPAAGEKTPPEAPPDREAGWRLSARDGRTP